jgi:hypothetical protein
MHALKTAGKPSGTAGTPSGTAGTQYGTVGTQYGTARTSPELPEHHSELPEHNPELPEHLRNCRNTPHARKCRNMSHFMLGTAGPHAPNCRNTAACSELHKMQCPKTQAVQHNVQRHARGALPPWWRKTSYDAIFTHMYKLLVYVRPRMGRPGPERVEKTIGSNRLFLPSMGCTEGVVTRDFTYGYRHPAAADEFTRRHCYSTDALTGLCCIARSSRTAARLRTRHTCSTINNIQAALKPDSLYPTVAGSLLCVGIRILC